MDVFLVVLDGRRFPSQVNDARRLRPHALWHFLGDDLGYSGDQIGFTAEDGLDVSDFLLEFGRRLHYESQVIVQLVRRLLVRLVRLVALG
jgi:hypothetical protein